MKNMFCKSCGNKIDIDSQFCSYCGTKQSDTNKPILINNEAIVKEDAKIVNRPISIGQQTYTKSNHEISRTYVEPMFDPSYKKDNQATIIGSIFLVSSFILVIIQPFKFDNYDSYNHFRWIYSIIALVIRLYVTIWVVDIAKIQNRETINWGLFAFFLPSIALIIIGQQKNILAKFDIDNSLSNEDNSLILTEKAQAYINDKKYDDCLRFVEKAIELDRNNKKASDLLIKARLEIPVKEISNAHTQVVFRETKDNQILKIVSNNYQTIGASVFINDVKAPDGEYYYLKDSRKLIVKEGKIEQMTN
ncbi:MAG: zinc-ribbon domain-containing protein [Bacteroidia bacterium]|nr:zinc-ribbon domain-containing protein [Bacteroidia bacterium]